MNFLQGVSYTLHSPFSSTYFWKTAKHWLLVNRWKKFNISQLLFYEKRIGTPNGKCFTSFRLLLVIFFDENLFVAKFERNFILPIRPYILNNVINTFTLLILRLHSKHFSRFSKKWNAGTNFCAYKILTAVTSYSAKVRNASNKITTNWI